MASRTPIGSQDNVLSQRAASVGRDDRASSPVLLPPNHQSSKPRKAPNITPRSFTRFFTPKNSRNRDGRIGASRQALRDITISASNRKGRRTPTKDTVLICEDNSGSASDVSKSKKRKITDPSEHSSPLKRICNQPMRIAEDESDAELSGSGDDIEDYVQKWSVPNRRIFRADEPIARSKYRRALGNELRREIGAHGTIGRARPSNCSLAGAKDWQYETTNFYTRPEDTYVCTNVAAPSDHTVPFCTASCNTNSLVAVGDADGGVRLLESAIDGKPKFTTAYLAFRPHVNAILDLAFSSDDLLLATASGDQSSRVIDMPTQRTTYSLNGHVSSVKQVCFQPGSPNVIATSSRDGSVRIWDLRCKGLDAPVRDVRICLEGPTTDVTRPSPNDRMTWARSVNTITEAHANRQFPLANAAPGNKATPTIDTPSKTESPGRRGDVSITALSFLPPGREHLLLTASEANASVKLWDLRMTHSQRRSHASPLSSTKQPESHDKHRHFGLTSLSLSGDGGRLYTLCRDSTIYAYSTAHLILGHAPELSKPSSKPRRSVGQVKEGLGPIYGFRHPKFHAATFYVKSAVRFAKDQNSELLAVGSSDGCAVIFPTDERYMQRSNHQRMHPSDAPFPRPRPALTRTDSGTGLSTRLEDTIPIYQDGSALVQGHSSEVTGLSWTHTGELVTVSDDFAARCWREGADARDLRTGGEKEGRRWGCGWAEATEEWDDDDGS